MGYIHETAKVHPTTVIEGDVTIGANTTIGPFCYLKGDIIIGENNKISSHVIIGEGPEHRHKPNGVGFIRIGNNNIIRELTVIQRGIGDLETMIEDDCYLMDHCHIAHDCHLGNGVTVAPNVVLAGHVRIQENATIGISCAIHQFSTIGAYSMIGMGTVVTKDIFPFVVVSGIPCKFQRYNSFHFPKFNITENDFSLDDGKLKSRNPAISKHFDIFYSNSRRGKYLHMFDDTISAT